MINGTCSNALILVLISVAAVFCMYMLFSLGRFIYSGVMGSTKKEFVSKKTPVPTNSSKGPRSNRNVVSVETLRKELLPPLEKASARAARKRRVHLPSVKKEIRYGSGVYHGYNLGVYDDTSEVVYSIDKVTDDIIDSFTSDCDSDGGCDCGD